MKIVKNLLLAMINATLILLALCLFLFWQVSNTAERIAGEFAGNLAVLEPVTQSVQGLNAEVVALRGDLSALMAGSGDLATQGSQQVQARISALQADLDQLQSTMDRIADTPDRLMVTAIDAASDKAANTLIELRGCQKPDA